MLTNELREKYLAFFESKGHARCPSDVLVPTWDPSVLFTPAGMNQFKDHFLGKVKLDFTRATTSQKCLRTGDIDNVGRTAYHHTFFEMLGNFSFGDYFKRDAINWAWEFLTADEWLGIDADRLTVTVYHDDDEAAGIWQSDIGLTTDRIERMGEDDNFWPAGAPTQGPDGVCGPCSEIFFHPDKGSEVEIWNLVFTQFNRVGDPPDNLRPLPSRNIDTGMGLERTAAVLQGVETNYHIDNLMPIVNAAAEICGVEYSMDSDVGRRLRRITDHVRACTMAVHENVYPGAKKEKYVIRKLLRRAVLDGYQMGLREAFLYQLAPVVAEMMKVAYPEVVESTERVAAVIKQEEESCLGTIERGLPIVTEELEQMRAAGQSVIDGKRAAHIYSTYGFPPELFESLGTENGCAFDWDGFNEETAGESVTIELFPAGAIEQMKESLKSSAFVGYEQIESTAVLKGILSRPASSDREADYQANNELAVTAGLSVVLILDQTPFYAESGGQVGDAGVILDNGFRFEVCDTQKNGDLILHFGTLVSGTVRTSAEVSATVDVGRRQAIRRAHSATHILHYALQQNLGAHAQQQGSKVTDDWLRFDFTNLTPVDEQRIQSIEVEARTLIAADAPIRADVLPLATAREAGAMMLFGEKYPDPVRMVSMGEFSKELCGGTHLDRTGEVGGFEVIGEEGVAAGTRRITALTGAKADDFRSRTIEAANEASRKLDVSPWKLIAAVQNQLQNSRALKKQLSTGSKASADEPIVGHAGEGEPDYPFLKAALRDSARALNATPFEVPARVEALQAEIDQLTAQVAKLSEAGDLSAESLLAQAEIINGVHVAVAETPGANPNLMRQLIDQLRKQTDSVAALFISAIGDSKVVLVAGVSRDVIDRGVNAGSWVREVAPVVGGGGGGKPDMAQAGGKDPGQIPAALEKAKQFVAEQLA
ncbi:MAG: alanine--tRNA ligase [Pirellulaceae bacterium]|jgi:alanyl-tRNA synthetase|nr:alanine--tRNA ligase [Pirellulaceae bacterium]